MDMNYCHIMALKSHESMTPLWIVRWKFKLEILKVLTILSMKNPHEQEHLHSDTIMQQVTDYTCSSKGSLNIFQQNVHSLKNKKVNLEILLLSNLSTVDVLRFGEHWLFEYEISCYN